MRSKWIDIELGEFVELKRGYDLPKKDRCDGSVPIVSSSGESGYHDKVMAKGPGVITGRYGTIGKVFYIEKDYWPLNTTLYVKDFKGNDPLFVYYFLKTISYSDYSDKAAVPGINRNHLHKAKVRVPVDPVYQRVLATKLWSLDKKIELNRQTNQTLEQIAQAIFKSWFVDFEPVKAKIAAKQNGQDPELAAICAISGKSEEQINALGEDALQQLKATAALFPDALVESELGEVPEGWGVKSLDEIAHYQNGLALQKFRPEEGADYLPVLKIAQLKKGFADGDEKATTKIKPECIVRNGDVVFSWSGSLMVDVWCGGTAALNQHLFKVTSENYPKWFYYFWTKWHLEYFQQIAADKAVTMGHIKREHLSQAKCIIPSFDLDEIDVVNTLLEKQIEQRIESFTLQEVRDILLPKLLAGELDINNPQTNEEAVA
jgi:type I restriction enzyme S subunit